jgi:hypothetical protein
MLRRRMDAAFLARKMCADGGPDGRDEDDGRRVGARDDVTHHYKIYC